MKKFLKFVVGVAGAAAAGFGAYCAYKKFVAAEGYKRASEIERFANSQNVRDYIVQGRLMKEEIIPWKARPRYEWA